MSRRPSRREDAGPIWARRAARERRPAYSREQIVEAAMRIADTEGFEAVSMRRVAAELGAGTMTLYHYVRTKDDLITLMSDAIMGELVIPAGELPDGWRDGLAEIARRTRATFVRHPWILEHVGDDRNAGDIGPNGLRHVEQSLAVAARTGLPADAQFELVALVDDYVIGHALRTRDSWSMVGRAADEDRRAAALAYLREELAGGGYPHLAGALAGLETMEVVEDRAAQDARFARGLRCVLDGIELEIERRRKATG